MGFVRTLFGRMARCRARMTKHQGGTRAGACVRDHRFGTGPIRTLADLEDITSEWVHW